MWCSLLRSNPSQISPQQIIATDVLMLWDVEQDKLIFEKLS